MQTTTINDATDSERNRLAWQCRRGMRELDEILGHFLDAGYSRLDEPGREHFSQLLDYPDTVLLEVLMGRMAPADTDAADIVRKIRNSLAP
ncbi:MAG: succinate dehydrogenase assembly factor 2 [Pseudomonadota bacterium]